jgi:hypothetical protein
LLFLLAIHHFNIPGTPKAERRPLLIDGNSSDAIESEAAQDLPAVIPADLTFIFLRGTLWVCEPHRRVAFGFRGYDLAQIGDFSLLCYERYENSNSSILFRSRMIVTSGSAANSGSKLPGALSTMICF